MDLKFKPNLKNINFDESKLLKQKKSNKAIFHCYSYRF